MCDFRQVLIENERMNADGVQRTVLAKPNPSTKSGYRSLRSRYVTAAFSRCRTQTGEYEGEYQREFAT